MNVDERVLTDLNQLLAASNITIETCLVYPDSPLPVVGDDTVLLIDESDTYILDYQADISSKYVVALTAMVNSDSESYERKLIKAHGFAILDSGIESMANVTTEQQLGTCNDMHDFIAQQS